jgi:NADH-quinone oxidoreductase subunit N
MIAATQSQLLGHFHAPHVDWKGMSPLIAVLAGSVVVLMAGLLPGRRRQRAVPAVLAIVSLLAAIGLTIWLWPGKSQPIVAGALSIDALALGLSLLFYLAGIATILLSLRSPTLREAGTGEIACLLLGSIAGMVLLAGAENLVTLFIGIELLSIPLYIMCGSRVRQEASLEAGLKYLVVGSVGSATLLFGLAFLYGATATTDLHTIALSLASGGARVSDPLLLTGIALAMTGLAFKASVAPFHQWTPDVYQGAPTPVTSFMAVATKAAAFAILLRLFDEGLLGARDQWAPALAALAVTTIVIGNAGAIAQRSLKRMLAWSGVAQAGYMLAGIVVGTRLGLQAVAFYLAVYTAMNVAAFAVVIARERVSERGDDIASLEGLGRSSPWLAWPMTIAMLALAGFPATAGFIGKFYLIDAAVKGDYAWLAIVIVVGSMMSLVYYLRVLAMMWMGPAGIELPGRAGRRVRPVAGWSPEADARAQPEVTFVAVVCAALTVVLGIVPQPLFHLAHDVGSAFGGLV